MTSFDSMFIIRQLQDSIYSLLEPVAKSANLPYIINDTRSLLKVFSNLGDKKIRTSCKDFFITNPNGSLVVVNINKFPIKQLLSICNSMEHRDCNTLWGELIDAIFIYRSLESN